MEKKELRKQLLERLLSLAKDELKRRSNNVEENLSNRPEYKDAKVIMAFYPLKGEVDILRMIKKALGKKRVCFPVMDLDKKDLRVFEVNNLEDDFVTGPYGVREPDKSRLKEVASEDIDLVIVPGLAFDSQGNRLGRGAGFYDRFLKRIGPTTSKVGVAFDFQLLERLPTHPPFDETVDIVISE